MGFVTHFVSKKEKREENSCTREYETIPLLEKKKRKTFWFEKNNLKKSSYRCFASEGATRRSCTWMILKGGRDDLFFWQF